MALIEPIKRDLLGWQGVCGGLVVPSVAAFVTPSVKRDKNGKTQRPDQRCI